MYAIYMTRKKLAQIEKRIEKIKKELSVIAEMRPGTLSKQYKDPVTDVPAVQCRILDVTNYE